MVEVQSLRSTTHSARLMRSMSVLGPSTSTRVVTELALISAQYPSGRAPVYTVVTGMVFVRRVSISTETVPGVTDCTTP